MKRDSAGRLRDSAGKLVPDAALTPRARKREQERRAGDRTAEESVRRRKRKRGGGKKRNAWWSAARTARWLARAVGRKMCGDVWHELYDGEYGRGHVASYGSERHQDAVDSYRVPLALPLPRARVDQHCAQLRARRLIWLIPEDESPDDWVEEHPPDAEMWRVLLPLSRLSREGMSLARDEGGARAVAGRYGTARIYSRWAEVAVYVRETDGLGADCGTRK